MRKERRKRIFVLKILKLERRTRYENPLLQLERENCESFLFENFSRSRLLFNQECNDEKCIKYAFLSPFTIELLAGCRAGTSSRPTEQLTNTMEVSTDAISDREQKSLVKQCFEICSTLTDKGFKFSFSLKLGSSFNFSLSSEECSPKAKPRTRSRRPPAFYRRQIRRRAAFLEKKEKLTVPEEAVSENLLDKKVDSTVDNNTPLNLNPRAIYPRGSVESVEQEEDLDKTKMETGTDFDAIQQEDTVIGGFPVGNTRLGSNCEMCQQTINDKGWRHFPAQCGKCWIRTLSRNDKYSVV